MNGAAADPVLGSAEALDGFIRAFFNGTFPGKQWHHREHVILAAWHLLRYSEAETTERLRRAIASYNVSQGGENTDTSGYHETLTVFWIRVVAEALARQPYGLEERERIWRVADEFGACTGLHGEYYGFDVVQSVEARRGWVEPDLQPLPGEEERDFNQRRSSLEWRE